MLTSTLIRFLDRLIIADKSFACVADLTSLMFLSAADAEPRFPTTTDEAGEGGLHFLPAAGSDLARRFPFGLRIPAEIERSGTDAVEALAYDQALICSCSLARADFAPFEEDFLLDDEREATLTAARVYQATMAEAHPDEPSADVRVLLRSAHEKPAELSPMTLLKNLLDAGAGRVLLLHTPETGTIVAEVLDDQCEEDCAVFADYVETEAAYGARVSLNGQSGRLVRGYRIRGNSVYVFSEDFLSKNSRTGMLTAEKLVSFLR